MNDPMTASTRQALKFSNRRRAFSLSLGERAGVRASVYSLLSKGVF